MNVVITGSSEGMGHATAAKFVNEGHSVIGIDIMPCPPDLKDCPLYKHCRANIADPNELPDIPNVNILINNAGVTGTGMDIDTNLKGLMEVTRKYALDNPAIKSVLNQAAASAHMGTEYDEYVASKGGVIAYTKWVAKEIAKYGATCNSLSFGGVLSAANRPVIENDDLWQQIMDLTPLKKWTTTEEAAEWIYFMTVINKSCSGTDIIIDNLESLNGVFVWE